MIAGIALWERNPEIAERTLREIADYGVRWVVIPCSEERLAYDQADTRRVVHAARSLGLSAFASPWGVAGLFGGEGVRSWDEPLPAALRWLGRALALDPDGIYWDEPKGDEALRVLDLLTPLVAVQQRLYWNKRLAGRPSRATMERMLSVGVDAYDGEADDALWRAADLAQSVRRPAHVWARGFAIRGDEEDRWLGVAANLGRGARSGGANVELALWGASGAGASVLANDDPAFWRRAIAAARGEEG